jgi:CRP-like cAMP-binding protein
MLEVSEKKSVHCHNCPAWKQSAFHTLSETQLNDLQVKKTSFELQRGSQLSKKGTPTNGAYCIASGHAKIIWPEADGKESIVKIVSPSDMTGYRCLFSEDTFRATAVALGSIRGCFIPKENFNGLLKDDHQFNFEILKRMGNELKLAEKRLHSFCRERLAEALLILKESCGVQKDDRWVLDIQLTREEISSWIGSAKETVVRSLSEMKDEKVIEQDGLHIVIINIEGLKHIAGLTEQ